MTEAAASPSPSQPSPEAGPSYPAPGSPPLVPSTAPTARQRAANAWSASGKVPLGPTKVSVPSARQIVSEGGGLIAGMTLYALILAFLDYGTAGVHSWLAAKFTNDPTIGPGTPRRSLALPVPPARHEVPPVRH